MLLTCLRHAALAVSGALFLTCQDGALADPAAADRTASVSSEAASAFAGMTLNAAQLRIAALRAVQLGHFELAAELGGLLLRVDPEDAYGHFVIAQAELRGGDTEQARRAARQALRYAETDVQKHEAARVIAAAYARDERYFLSQIWMRRALMVAPSEALEARAGREFQALRGASRLRLSANLGIAPSSNVNGGASEEISTVDGLPVVGILSPSAQALAGTEAQGELALSYAIQRDARSETRLRGFSSARRVWLSPEAQDKAPDVDNGDFGSSALEFGVQHRRRLGEKGPVLGASATLGRAWQGGERAYDYRRAAFSLIQPVGTHSALIAGVSWQGQSDADTEFNDVQTRGAQLGLSHDFGAPGKVTLMLMGGEAESDNGQIARTTRGAQLAYAPAEALGPVELDLSLSAYKSHYPDYSVLLPVPGGREDKTFRADVDVAFTKLDYAGFMPVLNISGARSDSNVSRFETETLSFSLGFKSRF
ncbi:hypothetical protein [Alloyangia pacifica]|uniref:hypothetical protein n=1 Tax=Alloyangia pacifica TaxID=311180 RepID=UPI001CD3C1CE|nr:hypothetical protein [Alloyangia pacifica]MCA0993968.1 hypothetical protein [Alloyangia pacifica]